MKLAIADRYPGAYAVTISCIRCGRHRTLADIRADIEGPSFAAYFCDPTCLPRNATDATFIYQSKGWQNVGGQWRQEDT